MFTISVSEFKELLNSNLLSSRGLLIPKCLRLSSSSDGAEIADFLWRFLYLEVDNPALDSRSTRMIASENQPGDPTHMFLAPRRSPILVVVSSSTKTLVSCKRLLLLSKQSCFGSFLMHSKQQLSAQRHLAVARKRGQPPDTGQSVSLDRKISQGVKTHLETRTTP